MNGAVVGLIIVVLILAVAFYAYSQGGLDGLFGSSAPHGSGKTHSSTYSPPAGSSTSGPSPSGDPSGASSGSGPQPQSRAEWGDVDAALKAQLNNHMTEASSGLSMAADASQTVKSRFASQIGSGDGLNFKCISTIVDLTAKRVNDSLNMYSGLPGNAGVFWVNGPDYLQSKYLDGIDALLKNNAAIAAAVEEAKQQGATGTRPPQFKPGPPGSGVPFMLRPEHEYRSCPWGFGGAGYEYIPGGLDALAKMGDGLKKARTAFAAIHELIPPL